MAGAGHPLEDSELENTEEIYDRCEGRQAAVHHNVACHGGIVPQAELEGGC